MLRQTAELFAARAYDENTEPRMARTTQTFLIAEPETHACVLRIASRQEAVHALINASL